SMAGESASLERENSTKPWSSAQATCAAVTGEQLPHTAMIGAAAPAARAGPAAAAGAKRGLPVMREFSCHDAQRADSTPDEPTTKIGRFMREINCPTFRSWRS